MTAANLASQWIEFSPRFEAGSQGSPAEASSVGGVTYGYGASGSTCRYALSGLSAVVSGAAIQASALAAVPYPQISGAAGSIRWKVEGVGPDRGSATVSGSRTVVGFYRVAGNISVDIAVATASVDLIAVLVRHAPGGAPAAVATVASATYAIGTHTIAITPPSSGDLDVTGGAEYHVEIAYDGGSGEAYGQMCRYNLVKRGIE
jgi:hypothetical protein